MVGRRGLGVVVTVAKVCPSPRAAVELGMLETLLLVVCFEIKWYEESIHNSAVTYKYLEARAERNPRQIFHMEMV